MRECVVLHSLSEAPNLNHTGAGDKPKVDLSGKDCVFLQRRSGRPGDLLPSAGSSARSAARGTELETLPAHFCWELAKPFGEPSAALNLGK